jgi:hypothetical protein
MIHTEQLLWIVFIPLIITVGIVAVMFYLMLFKTDLWLEWFVNKPYRWWGLQVTIVDKERFRKATHTYAMIPLLMAILGILASLFVGIAQKGH